MSYFHTCPDCGANLDPGEECQDCKEDYEEEMLHEDDSEKDRHRELQRV